MDIGQFRPPPSPFAREISEHQRALMLAMWSGVQVHYLLEHYRYAYIRTDTYENVSKTVKALLRRAIVEKVHSEGYKVNNIPVKREEVRLSSKGQAMAASIARAAKERP